MKFQNFTRNFKKFSTLLLQILRILLLFAIKFLKFSKMFAINFHKFFKFFLKIFQIFHWFLMKTFKNFPNFVIYIFNFLYLNIRVLILNFLFKVLKIFQFILIGERWLWKLGGHSKKLGGGHTNRKFLIWEGTNGQN